MLFNARQQTRPEIQWTAYAYGFLGLLITSKSHSHAFTHRWDCAMRSQSSPTRTFVSHQSSLARRMRTNPERSLPHATVNFSLKRTCRLLQVSGTNLSPNDHHGSSSRLTELSTAVVIIPPNHLAPRLSFVGPDGLVNSREKTLSV